MFANARNEAGQAFPITYWVEAERVEDAEAAFLGLANIQIKSIHEAIDWS